jgi:hypothetical protein
MASPSWNNSSDIVQLKTKKFNETHSSRGSVFIFRHSHIRLVVRPLEIYRAIIVKIWDSGFSYHNLIVAAECQILYSVYVLRSFHMSNARMIDYKLIYLWNMMLYVVLLR